MRKFKSKTHDRRASLRNVSSKAWPDLVSCYRAFSNTEGDRGDSSHARGRYYEAVQTPGAHRTFTEGEDRGPICRIYVCTRVFTRERELPIIIGGDALEAAQTMVWLGTNQKP